MDSNLIENSITLHPTSYFEAYYWAFSLDNYSLEMAREAKPLVIPKSAVQEILKFKDFIGITYQMNQYVNCLWTKAQIDGDFDAERVGRQELVRRSGSKRPLWANLKNSFAVLWIVSTVVLTLLLVLLGKQITHNVQDPTLAYAWKVHLVVAFFIAQLMMVMVAPVVFYRRMKNKIKYYSSLMTLRLETSFFVILGCWLTLALWAQNPGAPMHYFSFLKQHWSQELPRAAEAPRK